MTVLAATTGDGEFILVAGLVLAIGIGAAFVADRVRVPGLLLFLALGMIVGSEGVGGVDFDDAELTRTLGIIGLSLILFEGGLSAGWREIKPIVGVAMSLALIGTIVTTAIAGFAAAWIFDLGTKEGLILGAAIAATDSAAIFAVLRGSTLRRRIARSLEGESGLNDPVAILLVIGLIDWIQIPGYGVVDMLELFGLQLGLGAVFGIGVGMLARTTFRRLDYPTEGLYPVASIAAAALAYGGADVLGGSGFLAVYLTGLALGTGSVPGRATIIPFHTGVGWVSQIAFFFVLGLLVFPSELLDVAAEGLLLSAVLMFVARPVAALVATLFTGFSFAERLMLGWAGLRGAIPIWLATFPVIADVPGSDQIFSVVFFVVVTSTLIQGISFLPLAGRLKLTSTEPAVPSPLHEAGLLAQLGGRVLTFRVPERSWIAGAMIKETGLPREALVNVIVRGSEALPPRGSTILEPGDELHVFVRREAQKDVRAVIEGWKTDERPRVEPIEAVPRSGAPLVFTVGPWDDADGDPAQPPTVVGIAVARHLRTRRDEPGALVALADGRFAVTSASVAAVGGRRHLSNWCADRAYRAKGNAEERSWWQEVVGALQAPR